MHFDKLYVGLYKGFVIITFKPTNNFFICDFFNGYSIVNYFSGYSIGKCLSAWYYSLEKYYIYSFYVFDLDIYFYQNLNLTK